MNDATHCGCCVGIGAETPQGLSNRDGLSAVAYRIGDHARFRESMIAALSHPLSEYRGTTRLTTRAPDDFTIGLLDAFACTADVLTFYQERIANESWLRTATERISLQEMGKLVGYRLRPGVAAETWLAFALETPPARPPNLPPEPGNFVTGVPDRVVLDAGVKVQSVPGPGEKPQMFETVESLDARPEWNAMRPWLSAPLRPAKGATKAWLSGVADRPRPGDGVLFLGARRLAGADDTQFDFRLIEGVEHDATTQRTQLAWSKGLANMDAADVDDAGDVEIHLLRKRAAVFGHNAPVAGDLLTDAVLTPLALMARVSDAAAPAAEVAALPTEVDAGGGEIDLDAVYPDVRSQGYAVLRSSAGRSGLRVVRNRKDGLFAIDDVDEVSRAEPGIAAKVTRLQLIGFGLSSFLRDVRGTTVYLQSERVHAAQAPVDTPVEGVHVPIAASGDGLFADRRLIVRGTRVTDGAPIVHAATLVAAHAIGGGRCLLEIVPALPDPLVRASVVVHANVALATHGESVTQILGHGDGSAVFQAFALQHAPLTWLAAGNELGATPALEVRIGGVRWKLRDWMFGAGKTERAFALAKDAHDQDRLQFGDGVSGARLPTGSNNVVARYRKGLGAAGNVAPDKLTQLVSRPLGLKSVSNLLPAEGGTDPEPADAARDSIPLTTRTLGRVVSVQDYEDFARAFTGIAKAQARVLQPSAGTTIAITIAGDAGVVLAPSNPVWRHLAEGLRDRGDPHVPLQLLAHVPARFRLGLRVKCDPDLEAKQVLAAVDAQLRARFSFAARALGQPVQQSEVFAAAHAVPGVVAVDITRFHRDATPSVQLRLLAARMRVEAGVLAAAEVLVLDAGPLAQLEVMP
jgi:hypothetical protein